jgi:hypothetical protein
MGSQLELCCMEDQSVPQGAGYAPTLAGVPSGAVAPAKMAGYFSLPEDRNIEEVSGRVAAGMRWRRPSGEAISVEVSTWSLGHSMGASDW